MRKKHIPKKRMTAPQAILYHNWLRKMEEMLPHEHKGRLKSFVKAMIGLLFGRGIHMKQIARRMVGQAQQTSKERTLLNLFNNDKIDVWHWYKPLVIYFLRQASQSNVPLRLLIDGTKVGNGHQLLMIALAYRRRAIPLCWTWVKGSRGHSSANVQLALWAKLQPLIDKETKVIVLGDSEFGAVEVLQQLEAWHWFYVLRQKGDRSWRKNEEEDWQRLDALVPEPQTKAWVTDSLFTQAHDHRTHLVAIWKKGFKDPWLLTTNLPTMREALLHYSRRAWIENFFGDCKGNGFDLEATRLQTSDRLSRLTLAVVMLIVWLIAFGSAVIKNGQRYLVDRTDRRDLSIFRIGLEMAHRLLTNGQPLKLHLKPYF